MIDYQLEDQRPNEEIIYVRKMHPWVLAKAGFISILLILIIITVFLIFKSGIVSFIFLICAIIIIIFIALTQFFIYKNTIFILTNLRIINILQSGIFHHQVQEIELKNIYNLQYKIKGFIKSVLNFGEVELTTIGDRENSIIVKNIENPHFVYEKISKLKEDVKN